MDNGDADGMMAADVKKKWSKFENINGNTFRAKLKSVRDKFGERCTNNQSTFLIFPFLLFLLNPWPNARQETEIRTAGFFIIVHRRR